MPIGKQKNIGGGFPAETPWNRILMDRAGDEAGGGTGTATATATPEDNENGDTEGDQLFQQVNDQVDQRLSRFETTVSDALQQSTETQKQLAETISQLTQPRTSGSRFFGGRPGDSPGIRQGEDPNTSRGYHYFRVCALKQGSENYTEENCKTEMEVHEALHKFYHSQGFRYGGRDSILCPLGSQMVAESESGLGHEIGQMLAAGITGADPEAMVTQCLLAGIGGGRISQALSIYDDANMGVFTNAGPQGELIALLRAREVFSRAGATPITLPPNGVLPFPKQTSGATAYWLGEAESITASTPGTGSFELSSKKLGAFVTSPNELLRFGNPSTEQFIRNDLVRVMALAADSAMLDAVGTTTRIKGLITYAGITTYVATTTGANGNTFEPKDVNLMISEVEEKDHDLDNEPFTWVLRAKMWHNLENRRAAAHTAGTFDGPWLFPANRTDIANGAVQRLRGYPVVTSSQVSNTRAKGSSSDLTYILGGLFMHWLIGRIGVVEFATSDQTSTNFQTDQTSLRAIQHLDAAPRYENAFVFCDTLDMDLPA